MRRSGLIGDPPRSRVSQIHQRGVDALPRMMSARRGPLLPLQGNRLLTSVGIGGLLPTWALLVTQTVVQPCGCAPERMPWGNSRPGALWHRAPGRTASESRRLRHGDGAHGRGDRAAGGPGPQGNPVQFPHSQCIPTSIPSEFPRIEVGGGHWDKTRWSRRFKRRLPRR
jgi:hypothetical protein